MIDQPPRLIPTEEIGNPAVSLGWDLHHLAVATAALDTVLAQQLGLSSTDYLAMKHLLSTEQPLGPADLSRLLGMSTGSATAMVDRLQRAGHVERRAHPDDRRRLIIHPTASITAAITAALQPLSVQVDDLAGQFTAQEHAVVHRFLTAATQIHRDYSPTSG